MKTREELFQEAAEHELITAERDYNESRRTLDYTATHGTDEEFNNAWARTEKLRNNLNWLRSVRK